jgi:hypothetical protein
MSFTELKDRMKELTPEELDDLALLVEHLRRVNDPAWREEMVRRADAMQAGDFVTKEEVLAIHERLIAEGR